MYPDNKKDDKPENTELVEIPDEDIEIEKTGLHLREKLMEKSKNEKKKSTKKQPKSKAETEKIVKSIQKIDGLSEEQKQALINYEVDKEKEKNAEKVVKELEVKGKIRPKKGWKKKDYLEKGVMPPQSKIKPLMLLIAFLIGVWVLVTELTVNDVIEDTETMTISKYQIQIDELKEKYANLATEQKNNKLKLQAAQKKIEQAQKKLTEHSKLIKKNRASITEGEGKIKKIDDKILELAQADEINTDEIKKLKEEKDKIKKDIDKLRKTDEQLMKKQNELENQQNEFKKQQDEIKDEVKQNRKSITDLMIKQLNLEKDTKQTKEELEKLKRYLQDRGILPDDWDLEDTPEGNQP